MQGDSLPLPRSAVEHVSGGSPQRDDDDDTHDGLRVVRLHLLSRPDVGSLHRGEEVALSGDDALHLRVETCQ